MRPFLSNALFVALFQLGNAGWNAAQAQFSTAGFDTIIIEKKYKDDFIYWFGEPYGVQARMIYEGLETQPMGLRPKYQRCRWLVLTGQGEEPLMIDFRIRNERGVVAASGMHYEIPNRQDMGDPASATQAPIAIPTYKDRSDNGQSRLKLEAESPVNIYGRAADSIVARLYTSPTTTQLFKRMISLAKRAANDDLPVLGHARYDPTMRDAGLVVHAAKRNYVLLCSGAQRRAWIFRDDLLLAMFQYDLDHIPAISAPAYDFRIEPYMFVRPGLQEVDQRQLPFLLMLARSAAELVKDSRYF